MEFGFLCVYAWQGDIKALILRITQIRLGSVQFSCSLKGAGEPLVQYCMPLHSDSHSRPYFLRNILLWVSYPGLSSFRCTKIYQYYRIL